MKARINTNKTLFFLDTQSEVSGIGSFVAEAPTEVFVDPVSLSISSSITFSAVPGYPGLYATPKFYVKDAGNYEITYKSNSVPIYRDILSVGLDPVSDIAVSAEHDLVVDSTYIGGIAETVKAHVFDASGEGYGPEVYATFIGDEDISTTHVFNGETLKLATNGGDTIVLTIAATAASTTGAAGTFAAGQPADIAYYSVNGGPKKIIRIDGISGVDNYVAWLNGWLKGVTASNEGGQIKLVSDLSGSSSTLTISDSEGAFLAKTGLAEGTSTTNGNNVINADNVPFSELKTLIDGTFPLISSTQEDGTGHLVLKSNKKSGDTDIAGIDTSIALVETTTLSTRLGLAGLSTVTGAASSIYGATYYASKAGYSVPNFKFLSEGDYFVLWTKEVGGNDVPVYGDPTFVVQQVGKEFVRLRMRKNKATSGDAQQGIAVTVHKSDGSQVGSGVTDSNGYVDMDIYPGDYKVVWTKSGVVWRHNAVNLTVNDSASVSSESPLSPTTATRTPQGFEIFTDPFEPTITDNYLQAASCELYATLFTVDNKPLANVDVYVAYAGAPQVVSGYGVAGGKVSYKTDANGYVSFKLMQGAKVEVSVALMSFRRTITVPSGADADNPVNLLTLMSSSSDPMDILIATPPAAPRRTL
mgnify:CR=1 FL=1